MHIKSMLGKFVRSGERNRGGAVKRAIGNRLFIRNVYCTAEFYPQVISLSVLTTCMLSMETH